MFLWSTLKRILNLAAAERAYWRQGVSPRVVSCVRVCRSNADIRGSPLPWHCPPAPATPARHSFIEVPLLSSHSAPLVFQLSRGAVVGVSLSHGRLFLSLFICMLQCNTTPAAAYSNTLQCTTVPGVKRFIIRIEQM